MHKFLRTMTAAAVAAAMAPAFAADATYNVDVVVVGAGAAGTAAGWAAAEKGLKVVTLEKQAMVGGTGKFSEGIFAVESSMQRNWNYGLTKDEAFQKIMNYGHWRGNAKMVRAFVDKSGETIDWMQANGVKFEKLFSNYPNGLYTWHIYEGRGAGWINLFQQKYKDAGQTLLLNTWGKEWQKPVKDGYEQIKGGVERVSKLLEVTALPYEKQTQIRLLLDKATEVSDLIEKDGSWGAHASHYLQDRVKSALSYIDQAQTLLDKGGY